MNKLGRKLHHINWMVFAELIEFEIYELKRSHVHYNPKFTWQVGREIHFLLFL